MTVSPGWYSWRSSTVANWSMVATGNGANIARLRSNAISGPGAGVVRSIWAEARQVRERQHGQRAADNISAPRGPSQCEIAGAATDPALTPAKNTISNAPRAGAVFRLPSRARQQGERAGVLDSVPDSDNGQCQIGDRRRRRRT
jgi:hypothetical protein